MVKIIVCPCFLSIWRQQWLCLGYFLNKFVFISLRDCLALHIVFFSVTVLYLFDIDHCISLCHCVVWHWTFRAFPFQFVGGFLFPLSSFVCPSRPAGEVANMPSSLKNLFLLEKSFKKNTRNLISSFSKVIFSSSLKSLFLFFYKRIQELLFLPFKRWLLLGNIFLLYSKMCILLWHFFTLFHQLFHKCILFVLVGWLV